LYIAPTSTLRAAIPKSTGIVTTTITAVVANAVQFLGFVCTKVKDQAPQLVEVAVGKRTSVKCEFTLGQPKGLKANGKKYAKGNDMRFFQAIAWGNEAKAIVAAGLKGWVLVTGTMEQDNWEYEGKRYSKQYVIVKTVEVRKSTTPEA
jgi:hypothetical protein